MLGSTRSVVLTLCVLFVFASISGSLQQSPGVSMVPHARKPPVAKRLAPISQQRAMKWDEDSDCPSPDSVQIEGSEDDDDRPDEKVLRGEFLERALVEYLGHGARNVSGGAPSSHSRRAHSVSLRC